MTQGFNPFAGVRDAKISGSGEYLEKGNYKCRVTKFEWVDAQEGYQALVVKFLVVESDNPRIKVGSERSWFQKKNKSFNSEVKAFCIAAVGYDHRNEAHADAIRSRVEPNIEEILFKGLTENRLKDREFKCSVYDKPQKGDPTKSYSKHVFKPAQPPMF